MSSLIPTPIFPQPGSITRMQDRLQSWISPHPSIVEESERRRAQLLSILSLLQTVLTLAAGIFGSTQGIFFSLAGISLLTYLFSRTKYYLPGAYLFTYSLSAIAYIRIYLGAATSVESAISTSVHIAIVLASVLLPSGGFLILVALATAATFSASLYSSIPVHSLDNITRSGGIVLSLGALLYGVDLFLANLDRARLSKLKDANLELQNMKSHLEQRVTERTVELSEANRRSEERARHLQSISEISQGIVENVNQGFQDLLAFICRSISEKTGHYHIGLFLLNEKGDYAVLQASNSAGGLKMLERHHQLKVGGAGIVGYVAQSGRPRVALDTGKDAVFFNNPDLPGTHSEMALPLRVGSEILGVLDIQSTAASAFNDEDVTILATLANQIAIIIQNTLLRRGGEALDLPLPSARRIPRLLRLAEVRGFTYLSEGTLMSSGKMDDPLSQKAMETGEIAMSSPGPGTGRQTISLPVKFRDAVIGVISISSEDEKRRWSEDEILMAQAISERAALALENAALLEQTEKRAEQERIISDISSRIGDSNEVDHIMHTTIQELGRILGTTRTFIQLSTTASAEEA